MSDSHEPLRQNMQQVSADEFLAVKLERPVPIGSAVLVAQLHPDRVHAQDAGVGNGNAVAVTRQIFDHGVGMIQAVSGVHHPVLPHQCGQHPIDLAGTGEAMQVTGLGSPTQDADQGAAEAARQRAYREQIGPLHRLPGPIVQEGSARNEAV